MQVNEATRNAFKSDSALKTLRVVFPQIGLTIPSEDIYEESLLLKESVCDSQNIEFVGCISSMLQLKIHNLTQDVKNKRMQVWICADNTEQIKIFDGIVDSAKMDSGKKFKNITAYDELYTKGNEDLATWYNSLPFPLTLGNIRQRLLQRLGIREEEKVLPNDEIMIARQYEPKTLKALDVLKAICQINGMFGIINREGKFEYRELPNLNITFPSIHTFAIFYPANNESGISVEPEMLNYYRSMQYEEYFVKLVDKLTIRQNDDEAGITIGAGTNNYIIQGNMWTLGLDNATLTRMATNIFGVVKGVNYHPFECTANGLPYLEVGKDVLKLVILDMETNEYKQENFYMINRTLKGIQALKDTFKAEGEEEQSIFLSDLNQRIDQIKRNLRSTVKSEVGEEVQQQTYTKEQIDEKTLKCQSVATLPATLEPNTIYLIQGKVVVN